MLKSITMSLLQSPVSFVTSSRKNVFYFKIFIVLFLGFIFFMIPKDYLGDTYPICLFRVLLDKNCLGCGTTRAVWSVLHFRFADAFDYNKLIIITFPLIVGCTIKWILNEKDKIIKK